MGLSLAQGVPPTPAQGEAGVRAGGREKAITEGRTDQGLHLTHQGRGLCFCPHCRENLEESL